MKFAIIRERKSPPDRRVVFTPEQLGRLNHAFAKAEFTVESSPIRIFSDAQYAASGITVQEDVSNADVMIGVKEVPMDALIPNKKYFFFSHTIKKQPYNRELLRAILNKKIELYDHETIVKKNGARLIGFGRYAGIVGAYNGFRALGLRDGLFELPKVENLPDYKSLKAELHRIKCDLPPINIAMTGVGKVAGGIIEVLEELHIHALKPKEYLQLGQFNNVQTVYTQLDVMDYYTRKDGYKPTKTECYNNPELLKSDFMKYAKVTDMLITGHFYGNGAPYFFTREDMRAADFKINLVADVSCDIDGPIACTIRPSTIADPIYAYDASTEKEVPFKTAGAITVMAVDNLPCELPKDASEGFGEMFEKHVIPAFFNGDKNGILERAQMTTSEGTLTERFSYLQDFVDGDD
ncbi:MULTISPECIES: NAD(P)-dependent oxidoreductase [Nonlabens]|uniref:Alanine dehydrogenase n=1 Tax=Nonlabens ulvanivorans TaxID=906888 RepID=A0A084JZG4_NONUL|nr:NAD(P)-dependent oxidoreductase [Nonlabens ulvanivorans]KEZ94348.1 alanine dehydrogenase [Nonlabens ulvanivorans]PRX12237.1 alanine dehydrogenase/PNT-like protein [Nonlabens ulvanivorans]